MPRRPVEESPSRIYKKSKKYQSVADQLGLGIKELRESKGWTQEKASEAMHIDLKHLQKIEAGMVNVTLVTLVRIAEGFTIDIASLFHPQTKAVPEAVPPHTRLQK